MHETVLLREAVTALVTTAGGFYVDGTFGRGGHARRILDSLDPQGRLLAVDKDPQAEALAREWMASEPRLSFYRGSFADLPAYRLANELPPLDGILLDLGVSSPQLDQGDRGFSFQHDGPLDMRMDNSRGETAAAWLARAEETDIMHVLRELGEERFARRIAAAIVRERALAPITHTGRLAQIVSEANPRWEKHKHPATRSFQAIRLWINRELDDLRLLLDSALDLLAGGGRLVVISFHSLEDRIVKRYMRDQSRGAPLPRGLPVPDSERVRPLRLVGKAVRASADEVAQNPRARSAIMRIAEKVA
ncbi:16S rRNA (cytosine(1402)-N(4))-methyltransferase RsmH [Chromatocurvus halotolerans]|uniref:Ribosomal RNA small subunit methyltransferase H n=1 Tax=Chromatocurvus halotolerans TaxID=1132028 RepID=A0A4R2KRA6_9GAMM|nr:16S rRNA (cytosine(1402)-N(4))-methyltransferase RsmH [Chromatocurvus halotolerans]TCO76204.1 16S rRNA (cytosine1402-N4)-methyltransferase [Chromatocurvus halotolerans]